MSRPQRVRSKRIVFFGEAVALFLAVSVSAVGCGEENLQEVGPALSIEAPADVIGPPGDAEVTDSGLASVVLAAGTGNRFPTPADLVRVHYTGWTTDGRSFDSSIPRGEPSQFPVRGVIQGWVEGLQLMVEGEKRRFWIPENLAYRGRSAPFGMLVFDVELLAIVGE